MATTFLKVHNAVVLFLLIRLMWVFNKGNVRTHSTCNCFYNRKSKLSSNITIHIRSKKWMKWMKKKSIITTFVERQKSIFHMYHDSMIAHHCTRLKTNWSRHYREITLNGHACGWKDIAHVKFLFL